MDSTTEVYAIDAQVYIPGALVSGTGCTVSGTTVTKTGGAADTWDAQCTSAALVGNAQCSFSVGQINKQIIAGFSTNALGDASYTSVNYGIYFTDFGALYAYESGIGQIDLGMAYATTDSFSIKYNGSTVKYYKNGVEIRSVAASAGLSLSFDSSFYSAGAALTNVIVGSVDTKRFATHGIYYNNKFYEPRIKNPWNFQQTLFLKDSTSGDSTSGFGVVELINNDGGLDTFTTYGFDGRPIVLRKIIAGVATLLMSCGMEQPTTTWDTVSIRIKDKQILFNVPIQPTKYGGTNVLPDGVDGTDDIKGKPKPLLLGQVSNATPFCVNTSRLIYQGHESALQDITAVYDKGVSLARGTDYSSAADMQANQPAPGEYRAYLAGGMFRLGSSPAGQITFDAIEGATAADRTAAQIAKRIALRALPSAEISAADVTALDTANSAVVGIYINSESTIQAALNEVLDSVGAAFTFDSAGVLRMTRIVAPAGSPVATYGTSEVLNIERKPTNDEGRGVPPYKVNLGYGKNNTVQNANQLAGIAVGEINKNWLKTAFSLYGLAPPSTLAYGNGCILGGSASSSWYLFKSVDDGKTWTLTPDLPASTVHQISFGAGRWIAKNSTSTYYTSDDNGVTWVPRTNPFGAVATPNVFYANGKWLWFKSGTTTGYRSDDGASWTAFTLPDYFSADPGISYGNGRYVAAGPMATMNIGAVSSTDCITWTQQALPATDVPLSNHNKLVFGNARHVLVIGSYANFFYSDDALTWTKAALPKTPPTLINIAFAYDQFMISGSNGFQLIANDGSVWLNAQEVGANSITTTLTTQSGVIGFDTSTAYIYARVLNLLALVSAEYRTVTAVDSSILIKHPTAREINKNTLIVSKTAAQTEADRLLALKKVDRDYMSIKVDNSLVPVDIIGKVVSIKIPRYGYDNGKLFVVLGTIFNYEMKQTELLIWG